MSRTLRARNGGRVRALLIALSMVAFSAIATAVASPATAKDLSGTGPGSVKVTLAAGLYEARLTYENNVDEGKSAVFAALLESTNNEHVVEYLALDRKEEWSSYKVVQLFERTTLKLSVEAAEDATWKVAIDKTDPPPADAQSKYSVRRTGVDSSPMIRLKAATYEVTTSFKGNAYAEGLEDFSEYGMMIRLYGVRGDDRVLLESTKSSGTVTKTIKIASSGIYWVNPLVAPTNSLWSVKMVALKKLTTATPKISGTAKVGKTLTAKPGTWTSGTKFTYQWYRGSSKISGATKSTYKLTSSSVGKKLKVKMTGKKAGYTTVTKTSAATATVRSSPA